MNRLKMFNKLFSGWFTLTLLKRAIFALCTFVILVVLLHACTRKEYVRNDILEAENYVFSNPDSCLFLLKNLPDTRNLTEHDKAYLNLVRAHAAFRTNLLLKADSNFLFTFRYFSNSSYKREEAIACYLAANFHELNHQLDSAVICYKNAEKLFSLTDENRIRGLNLMGLGYLYAGREMNDIALEYFLQSAACFEAVHDEKYLSFVAARIAVIYKEKNDPNALKWINKAIQSALLNNDSASYQYNLMKKGEILFQTNPVESKKILLNLWNVHYSGKRLPLFLAYIYNQNNQLDSASIFFDFIDKNSLSDVDLINYKIVQANLLERKKDFAQSVIIHKQLYMLRDSLYRVASANKIKETDAQFNLLELEKENLSLKMKRNQNFIVILITGIVFLLIMLQLLRYNFKTKKKNLSLHIEKLKLASDNKDIRLMNEQKKAILQSKLSRHIRMQIETKQSMKSGDFTPNENNWTDFVNEANEINEGKFDVLVQEFPQLTNHDLIIIVMIWLHFDICDCADLMNVSRDTIYKRRQKIKDKLQINEPDTLETRIYNL